MKQITYKMLDKKYKKEILDISVKCFLQDKYYDYLGCGEQKEKALYKMYKEAYKISEKIGEFFGAFYDEELVGFVKIYDFDKLKSNSKYYKTIFDYDESDYVQDLNKFLDYAQNLKHAYYLVAICILPQYQKQGIGTQFIDFISEKYKNYDVFADVDNPLSLSMYKKANFEIIQISDKFYFVIKHSNKIL